MNDSPRIRLDSRTPGSRWTCRPGEPAMVLECEAESRVAMLRDPDGILRMWDDPLAAIEWMPQHLADIQTPDARWIGYFSYDLARLFHTLPQRAVDDLQMPLFAFTLHHAPCALPWSGRAHQPRERLALSANFTRDAYLDAVDRAQARISAGEVSQVNLSQRFTAALTEHPSQIYERLRRQSPAVYGAYLDHLDYALICNSSELFLRVDRPDPLGRRCITTRPLSESNARGSGMAHGFRERDRAELKAMVDLQCSDLGPVCEIGSVKIPELAGSGSRAGMGDDAPSVEGLLRADVGLVELLRATFPAGSVSGAPRVPAMEIIDEVEPTRRGPSCGGIGYIAADGRMEFNIAVRSMIVRDGLVHLFTGGGIVADSDPIAEYNNTLIQAQAMFAALGISDAAPRALM